VRSGFASFLFLLALSSSAQAQPIAPRLVHVLDAPGRPHPLADRSGRIPVTARLPAGVNAAAVGLLPVAPGVGAARLWPDEVAAYAAANPDVFLSIAPPLRPQLDVSGKWTNIGNFRTSTNLSGEGVLVGVVDTGLDVRHPDFRDENGKTRVAWLLLAGASPKGKHPDLEEKFGCNDPKGSGCAVYSADDIDAVIASGSDELHDREGHGTHVASIAAGNGGVMLTKSPVYVGAAPKAQLIVAAPSDNGGFYDADILNATRFVFDRADFMKKPVVVNLSLGGDYGSHDGEGSLEKGLSALVGDDKPGHAIVVAAGNSGALTDPGDGLGPYGIHTEVHVSPHETTRVPILAGSAVNGQAFVWITFRPGDEVEVALDGHDGRWVGFTGPGDENAYGSGNGTDVVKAGVVNNLPKANPSLTPDTNSAVVVWTGHWPTSEFAVLLRGSGDASLWITGTGDAAGELNFARALRQGTVNVPATAPALLAVGCTLNRVSWKPFKGSSLQLSELGDDPKPVPDGACYFSAGGPTPFGVQKPEISAPGGFVAAAMSADADPRKVGGGGLFDLGGCPPDEPHCAIVDDHHAIAAGTSMSAPHVTGAIALLMEIEPKLTQARATEVLQAGARRPTGHLLDGEQLGPGELDLEAARDVLLDATQAPADPDVSKSWYTLSSPYARPDHTWPVWGTIELRRMDGKIAGGIDGSKLALRADGGALYQPLTRVQPGLWRFAVAGKDGDVGGQIKVDVTYAGMSLGVTTLPVGDDVWSANDRDVGAIGGACASPAGRAGTGSGAALAVAALVLAARRRARRNQAAR
jgi:subtilisin family serine protease